MCFGWAGGCGVMWGRAETAMLSSEFCESYTSRFTVHYMGQGSGLGEVKGVYCARPTTTRVRRHAEKDHKKQDPSP